MTWSITKQGSFASIEEACKAAETVPPQMRTAITEAARHFEGKKLTVSASGHDDTAGQTGNAYISITASAPDEAAPAVVSTEGEASEKT